MERQVFEFGSIYDCRYFFINNQYEGIEVRQDGELLGSIVGLSIPDEDDEIECSNFESEVINWIVDNEY